MEQQRAMEDIIARMTQVEGLVSELAKTVETNRTDLGQSIILAREQISMTVDEKIKTLQAIQSSIPDRPTSHKSILESKAMQEVGKLSDAKQYRQWCKKMKNAIEQSRPKARAAIEMIEKLNEEDVISKSLEINAQSKLEAITSINCENSPRTHFRNF